MEIDVGGSLGFCKRVDVVVDTDALGEVGKEVSFEDRLEVILSGEDDFEWGGRIERRADEESEVDECVGTEEMSLVDDEDGSEV